MMSGQGPGTQTFQLHDLAMVDEKVDVQTVPFDISLEHGRVRRFEHDFAPAFPA